jgi:hypothetical protein
MLMCIAAMGVMVGLVAVMPAQAQSTRMQVTVPFAFHCGDHVMPTGTYVVRRLGEAIQLTDRKGNTCGAISSAISNKHKAGPDAIVFVRYANEDLYLSEIRWGGYAEARGLVRTKAERQLAEATPGQRIMVAAAR